jgi:hypothetical protein
MEKSQDADDAPRLTEIRRRRLGLRRAMTDTEEAASAPLVGRPDEWGSRLVPAVDGLRDAWRVHVSGTEGPSGLWEQIRNDAPRLDGNLRRLRRDHEQLSLQIDALCHDLADAEGDAARLIDARERVIAVLGQLARHRQRGADLIYEAYQHDIGGAG